MKWNPITRRHFLQGAGKAALSLPLLPSLLSKDIFSKAFISQAEAGGLVQKSFIGVPAYNGLFPMTGRPDSMLMPPLNRISGYNTSSPAAIAAALALPGQAPLKYLAAQAGIPKPVYYQKLVNLMTAQSQGTWRDSLAADTNSMGWGSANSIFSTVNPAFSPSATATQISPLINSNFNALINKMTMLQGFDLTTIWMHHMAHFGNMAADYTAQVITPPSSASIEQVMAQSSSFYNVNTGALGSSVCYTNVANDNVGPSYSFNNPAVRNGTSAVSPTPPYSSPQALWNAYFGVGGGGVANKTLVDLVLGDYKTILNSSKLGSQDKQSLQNHIAFLQQTQTKLNQTQSASSCSAMPNPSSITVNIPGTGITPANLIQIFQNMNSVIASLIACGLCNSFCGWGPTMLDPNGQTAHTWAHAGWNNPNDVIADPTSFAGVIGQNAGILHIMCLDLAQKLDAISAGNGTTLLDNSLITYIMEHSDEGHYAGNLPVILMGGSALGINTGYYLDYRNFASGDDNNSPYSGYPINQLWGTLLQIMGVPATEYEALNPPDQTAGYNVFKSRSGYGYSQFVPANSCPSSSQAYNFGINGSTPNTSSPWYGYNLSTFLPGLKGTLS